MKFVLVKPPKFSLYCYLIGFVLIFLSFGHYYFKLDWLSNVAQQQIFIGGAIIVAVGSVINWLKTINL